jgi:Cytochrome c554 and c-prime
VIGSGRKGQSFLYWNENKLFQLPVSYYSAANAWCNSPGYPATLISFDRQVNAQCLECHATFARESSSPDAGSGFDKPKIIYGIQCERCHGDPGRHITYYQDHPADTLARFIITAGRLTRQQRLDACALCHSGLRKETRPPFSFTVGDTLDDFSIPAYDPDSTAALDVHGNQYGLLTSSKCFRLSQMDCASCHNVHNDEHAKPALFSQRCLTCHGSNSPDTCTLHERKGIALQDNCIDCHMPLLPSKKIFLQLSDGQRSTADYVRTHRIAVYADVTKAFLRKSRLRLQVPH